MIRRMRALLTKADQPHRVYQAVSHHGVALAGGSHIADDVAAARNNPGLEFLRENGGGKVCHGSGGIVPQLAE